MLLPKLFGLLSGFILVALPAVGADAIEPSAEGGATNPPPALKAAVRGDDFVGGRTVNHAYVTFGTNRFSFIVPDGYRVDSSNPEKLVVVNEGYDCFIGFRVVSSMPPDTRELKADTCRELLLSRYPGAQITEEYIRTVANHSGPAFDFQWRNASGTMQAGRVIFVPMTAGIVEFSLITREDIISVGRQFFHALVRTFRTDESGKLEVVHFAESV